MKKYTILAVIFYFLGLLAYIGVKYHYETEKLVEDNYNTLIKAAAIADIYLPASLHTPHMNQQSISDIEDESTRIALSRAAEQFGVKYIYSFVLDQGTVRFTSSSATPEELKTKEGLSPFWSIYDEPSLMLLKSFRTKTIQYDEETQDEWGLLRSAFVPHVSPSGKTYIIGADIEMKDFNHQLAILTFHSLIEAAFYIMILLPFFIAYKIQNRKIQQELEQQVKERTAAITRLLDNANQGFLTFSKNLMIDPEYSKKCTSLFGDHIADESISSLLFTPEDPKKHLFESTVISLFDEEDTHTVSTIISLLPHEFALEDKMVHVSYKKISNDKFMAILTDITLTKILEKNLEKEHNILKMTVTAISNREELLEIIDDFNLFADHYEEYCDGNNTPQANLSNLYRNVHTYKALFAQKDFILLPRVLHNLESRLSEATYKTDLTNSALRGLLEKINFHEWLAKDTGLLCKTLGEDFLTHKTFISIDEETFKTLYAKVKQVASQYDEPNLYIMEILDHFHALQKKPLKELFLTFPKYVEQTAQRLHKSIHPLQIKCEDDILAGNELKSFIKSLVHIFRNAIDHGIETPEERIRNNKEEYGTISLLVSLKETSLRVEISDDGRGIDFDHLKEKVCSIGIMTTDELNALHDLSELLFIDNLSTKSEVSTFSGRGFGMNSVLQEIRNLNGTISIHTISGERTTFVFNIPL